MEQRSQESARVRCLDCGTVYDQPDDRIEAAPCPSCGYVGWITVRAEKAHTSDS